MSSHELLTDDYVAGVLSQEANDCSLKFSAMGMDAFKSDKKPQNMPKPNTRFLRNIIKGTDSHNKALLAKEAEESQARLKRLERTRELQRVKKNPTTKDIGRRHMGDIQAILGGRKLKRASERDAVKPSDTESRSKRHASDHSKDRRERDRSDRHSRRDKERREDHSSSRSKARHHSPESRRHRSQHRESDERRKSHHTGRSRSPRRRDDTGKERHRHRSTSLERKSRRRTSYNKKDNHSDSEDSIGPAPEPKIRGRGDVGQMSGIDRRFSESYDPKTDTHWEGEPVDDWDSNVDAYRSRMKSQLHNDE
ncbi:hypothetical protein VHEMI02870 [[Torrubiella] hemipterigena]|uniref:Pre-mRNA-splicing factor 38B n=1 Tax=[Torrubiella] hemipterigena TaxID=1531966 RepID=A0A0A1SQX0_9HYPO|nr:hypothetical protein VHEMI02870 [[Torrubiella] hemipterigena]